jgi:hypothetical protein
MDYYKIELRNLTFAEQWRIARLGFPIAALCKIFRIPFPMRAAIAHPIRIVRLDESELDVDGRRARLKRDVLELDQEGIRYQFLYKVPMVSPDTTAIALAFLSDDRTIYGSIIDSVARVGTRTTRMTQVSFLTPLADGRFLATVSRRLFNSPAEVEVEKVTGRAAKILQRHRERQRSSIASSQTINSDDLEVFIADIENRAFEYQRERGVWVRAPTTQVEKLQDSKPRGRLWQKAVGWAVSIAVGVMVWAVGGLVSCPGTPDTDDVAVEVWSGETQTVIHCAGLEAETSAVAVPHVGTVVGLFDSAESAAVMEESTRTLLAAPAAPAGKLKRVANTLFFRTTGGERRDAKPVYDAWHESCEEIMVLGERSREGHLGFVATWRVPPVGELPKTNSIENCLDGGIGMPLLPPWVRDTNGQPVVTRDQENARRTLRKIRDAEYEEMEIPDSGLLGVIKMLWRSVTWDPEEWQKEMKVEQQKRIEGLETLAGRLEAEDPSLDAEVLDLYVQWQTDLGASFLTADDEDPFAEEPETEVLVSGQGSEALLRLQERLGALQGAEDMNVTETWTAEVDDPLAAFSVSYGWIERGDEEVGMRVILADPAIAVPAMLRHICEEEAVSEVTVGFSADEWW